MLLIFSLGKFWCPIAACLGSVRIMLNLGKKSYRSIDLGLPELYSFQLR